MINKNILEVCLSPDLGGLELYMQDCTNELSKNFNTFCVVYKNTKLKNFNKNIKRYEIKRKSSFSLIASFKIAKIIDKENIDIVHLHWTKDIPIVVFAKKISKKKPKIIQTRHMTMTRFKSDFYHRFLYKNIDTIICVTKELENQIKKFIPQNIRPKTKLLHLGAKEPNFLEKEEIDSFKKELKVNNSFMIGIVGRINEFKGQHLVIEAIKILKEKNLDVKLYIVGHAMSEEFLLTLKQKVIDYKLQNEVHFLGFTNEPQKFMQACDVIIMASKNETFGLVTIETMKNKTVVIASKSGGVLEIIEDEKDGLLFENRNSDDLALKIEKVYNDNKLKEKLEINGKEKVDKDFDSKKHFIHLISEFNMIQV